MNQAGIDLVKEFEGFRDRAYLDSVGVPTIGFGFTHGVKLGDTITSEEAEARLTTELMEFESGVMGMCTRLPTPNQSAALTSFSYNLGLNSLKGSTLLKKHNDADFEGAAEEFGKWIHAGGRVLPGLVARRAAERSLYLS